MSGHGFVFSAKTLMTVGVLSVLAAVCCLLVWVIPASADSNCNSGNVCVWVEYEYNGAKGESSCTGGAHPLAGWKYSAKNRCANKASWLRANGSAIQCVNPGNNNGATLAFNEVWIGAEGSRC